MSLDNATPINSREIAAYKVFRFDRGLLRAWLGEEEFKPGRVYMAEWSPSPERFAAKREDVPPGFHAYTKREDAEQFEDQDEGLVVRKVLLTVGLKVGESRAVFGGLAYSGQHMRIL